LGSQFVTIVDLFLFVDSLKDFLMKNLRSILKGMVEMEKKLARRWRMRRKKGIQRKRL